MDEDDFLLDEDEDGYLYPDDTSTSQDEEDDSEELEDESTKIDKSLYQGLMTEAEVGLINSYDEIVRCKDDVEEAATIIVMANPQHTSANTVSNIIRDLFNKQGHSRLMGTKYQQGPLKGADVKVIVDEERDEIDNEVNNELMEEMKEMINGFVEYLAGRDLSKDSVTSRRRKQRQLPALIIFLFSSGRYDFILDCPAMPEEYQEQITYALKKIHEAKYKVLEEMIAEYEKAGRQEVAETIRSKGLDWFLREPAEVRGSAEYRHLNLTSDDIDIYKKYRPRYTNLTSALTQDMIADLIEVVVDKQKGIYEKLKDKTRSEAINDVKKALKEWSNQYRPDESGIANKLIFKNS